MNVTFGNAPELIIAIFALADGLQEVVKASLVGSILGNCLLVLGAAMFAGGVGRARQTLQPHGRPGAGGDGAGGGGGARAPLDARPRPPLRLPSVSQVRHAYGGDLEAVSIAVASW